MNSYKLRTLQSSLKEKYKVEPSSAVVTLRTDMTSIEKPIKLTERYCIVLQTLQNSADIMIYKKHCP